MVIYRVYHYPGVKIAVVQSPEIKDTTIKISFPKNVEDPLGAVKADLAAGEIANILSIALKNTGEHPEEISKTAKELLNTLNTPEKKAAFYTGETTMATNLFGSTVAEVFPNLRNVDAKMISAYIDLVNAIIEHLPDDREEFLKDDAQNIAGIIRKWYIGTGAISMYVDLESVIEPYNLDLERSILFLKGAGAEELKDSLKGLNSSYFYVTVVSPPNTKLLEELGYLDIQRGKNKQEIQKKFRIKEKVEKGENVKLIGVDYKMVDRRYPISMFVIGKTKEHNAVDFIHLAAERYGNWITGMEKETAVFVFPNKEGEFKTFSYLRYPMTKINDVKEAIKDIQNMYYQEISESITPAVEAAKVEGGKKTARNYIGMLLRGAKPTELDYFTYNFVIRAKRYAESVLSKWADMGDLAPFGIAESLSERVYLIYLPVMLDDRGMEEKMVM